MPRKKKAPESAKTPTKTSARAPRSRIKPAKSKLNLQKYFSGLRGNFEKNRKIYTRYGLVTLLVILVAVFAFIKKDWFVAAVVNNQPITTLELYQNLKAKDGQAVLDQLIRDKLIVQEANKKGISISQKDIDDRIAQVVKQVGGQDALNSALAQQNLTQAEFKNQIKIQLMVEKILSKQIVVTDKEVSDYIAKNPAETKGVSRDDVKSQLQSTKLNTAFQTWYANLQKNSKIYKFI